MKIQALLSVFSLLILCVQNILWGQTVPGSENIGYPDVALNNAIHFYSKTIGEGTGLYNGREYNFHYINVRGNPFYSGNAWSTGSILYDGQMYDNINMKFDIYNDLLIIEYYDKKGFFINLQLVTEKIEYFRWPGHFIVKMEFDTTNSPQLESGFYDLLYEGSIRVLARYKKTILKNNQIGTQLEAFRENDFFYIQKNGELFKVKKKRSVIAVFSDKNHEIRAFIKKSKLKFKKQPGLQIAFVAEYYDSIYDK
jgi:hypothetical protein